jgi:glycerophosphoryl diester phosphodiesterase
MTPLVIAHRGASGYLPEHTLAAKGLAHDMGADYLEQDIVASRDDALVVLHDIYLDRVTDVAERYPGRERDDGRFYVRDFDIEELRSLQVWERMNPDGSPVYPERYPARSGDFRINTLREELAFIQRLNKQTGRQAGVYPEIKRPAWHKAQGIDIAPQLLEQLGEFGYSDRADPVFVQCFDDAELRRLKDELGCPFQLVQLIGDNAWNEAPTDFDELRTADGITRLAQTVDAIGPHLPYLYHLQEDTVSDPVSSGLVEIAHDVGLLVHPYTFRADELPPGFRSFKDLVVFFALELKVDGLFTDFPDLAVQLRGG